MPFNKKMQKGYTFNALSSYELKSDENQIGSQRGPDHNIATTPSVLKVHFPSPVSSTEVPFKGAFAKKY